MVIGVTKGYKYKLRYVYAHFPINVNIEKNKETGLFEVEIRYEKSPKSRRSGGTDRLSRNFLGEKIVRRVTMQSGVDVEASKSRMNSRLLEIAWKGCHNRPQTFNRYAE